MIECVLDIFKKDDLTLFMRLTRVLPILIYGVVFVFLLPLSSFNVDPREAQVAMQSLDLEWIRENFWQCLIYNHYQPPLYANILLGGLYCLARSWSAPLFLALNAVVAFAAFVVFLGILEKLKVYRWISFPVLLSFIFLPARWEWEQTVFYMSLSLSLMTFSIGSMLKLVEKPCAKHFWAVAIPIGALTILNSFFHWVWGVATLVLAVLLSGSWRRRLFHGLLAVGLILIVPAKNWVVFGVPSNSSSFGVVLAQRVGVFPPLLLKLIRSGDLPKDALCLIDPYRAETYLKSKDPLPETLKNIRCVTTPWKSYRREGLGVYSLFNYNYYSMIPVSKRQSRYALWYLWHYPQFYLSVTRAQIIDFFSTAHPTQDPSVSLPRKFQFKSSNGISWRCVVYLFSLAPGIFYLAATWKRWGMRQKILFFVLFQIGFGSGMGIFIAYLDGARYRYPFETAFLIFTAVSLSVILRQIRSLGGRNLRVRE